MTAETLPIACVSEPVVGSIRLPGSKSITNRALLLAALASGRSRLSNALFAGDTRYMADALTSLGVSVQCDETTQSMEISGTGGKLLAEHADVFVGNAGTAARFLTAYCSLGHGTYRIDGAPRMRERPIEDLLTALRRLGVDARSELGTGCPPVVVRGAGLAGGAVEVRGDRSSQFLSALLLVAPFSRSGVRLAVESTLVSRPYIDLTLAMMRDWGLTVTVRGGTSFELGGGQRLPGRAYSVEPDASGASYFMAAAAATGGRVEIVGLGRRSVQGDARFGEILRLMGCTVTQTDTGTIVEGPDQLEGIDVDMGDISDTVMTLAAIAPLASTPTVIRNVAHIRHKESDRIAAMRTELAKLGVRVSEHTDGLTILPGIDRGGVIETYDDHRMAMSFAILGLRHPGIALRDPGCVAKTFPGFFDALRLICPTDWSIARGT